MTKPGTRKHGPGARNRNRDFPRAVLRDPLDSERLAAETGTRIEVVAGVLQRSDGTVLLAERADGKVLAGYLEFPGGKIEAGETPEAALARELEEELAIREFEAEPLIRFEHAYPDFRARIFLYRLTTWRGGARAREGQRLRWVKTSELDALPLLPANRPALAALELPATLVVTPEPQANDLEDFLRRFERALANGGAQGAILRLRNPGLLAELAADLAKIAAKRKSPLLLNSGNVQDAPPGFAGVHLPAAVLRALRSRPKLRGWIGASVHGVAEAEHAAALGLDYVIAGSLRETPSHPGGETIGWEGFDAIVCAAGIPTYAIGGMTPADLPQVRAHWGQGIAAIRALWCS